MKTSHNAQPLLPLQASAKQRAGRAGRVKPGNILYMFTKPFHEKCMPAFDEAEMMRIPLEKTVLNVKLLMSKFGSTSQLLQQTLSPPPNERVDTAMRCDTCRR
jgi:HrpA-like RNA helicase